MGGGAGNVMIAQILKCGGSRRLGYVLTVWLRVVVIRWRDGDIGVDDGIWG